MARISFPKSIGMELVLAIQYLIEMNGQLQYFLEREESRRHLLPKFTRIQLTHVF
jgi:hypothetical protein